MALDRNVHCRCMHLAGLQNLTSRHVTDGGSGDGGGDDDDGLFLTLGIKHVASKSLEQSSVTCSDLNRGEPLTKHLKPLA